MDHIKSLYEEEIETYKQQIVELRQRNLSCDDKNATLINKIRSLEDIIDKANVANKDLNTAFEHVREENLRLQLKSSSQEQQQQQQQGHHSLILGGGDGRGGSKEETKAIEQYATLAQESLTWISERDQMNRRIKFLERECTRYHRDNTTLGKQVRHLLKSLEEERGMIIRHRSEVPEEDQNQIVTAADVIDKHLVTFESIEELQQHNQKLLTIVKNLGEEQEEREVQFESEEVKRLNDQLQELQSQLDSIKNDRERVLNALNTIHKERDLFKILLCKTRQVEHMTPDIFQRMVSVACASGPAIADKAEISAEREAHIGDLKEMISKLEQELVRVRAAAEDSRSQSAEEIKLKSELIEKAHAKIIEETKRADILNERNDVLEGNIKALTIEFDELRTRCHKLTFEYEEFKKKNEELAEAKESAERAKSDLDKLLSNEKQLNHVLEVNMKALTTEIDELRTRYHKLTFEYEEIKRRNDELAGVVATKNEAYESAEKVKSDLDKLLAYEKQLNQEAMVQISQYKEQSQQLGEALQRERQRTIEVVSELNHSKEQNRQTLANVKSDEEILKAQASVLAFQELRNFERARRLQFVRSLRSIKKDSGAPSNHAFVVMKKTTKKRLRLSTPPSLDVSKQENQLSVAASTANYPEEQQSQQEPQPPHQDPQLIQQEPQLFQQELQVFQQESQSPQQELQLFQQESQSPQQEPQPPLQEPLSPQHELQPSQHELQPPPQEPLSPQQEPQPPQVIKFKRRNYS